MASPVRSIYVHAPFCARRCVYCDFAVHVDARPDPAFWVEALRGEWEAVRAEGLFPVDRLDTLYVGGGTPSLLGVEGMQGVARVFADVERAPDLEWTVEANPESFDGVVAEGWRRLGVDRLSFGVQTFSPAALRWMGRLHGPEGPAAALRAARTAGFDNVSVDLIFALPTRVERDWSADLARALALEPDHVSLYGLGVEARTPLGRAVAEGREDPVDETRYREEFLEASERLREAGFEHYEVSNFARPGRRSRHNQVYWDGRPYLGLGNGAHSHQPPLRRWNLRDWLEYRERVRNGALPVEEAETVAPAEARLERIWLALRTREGFTVPVRPGPARDTMEAWVRRGLAEADGDRVRLTPTGWLLLDELAVELDRALDRDPPPAAEPRDGSTDVG